jgi:hypothetical protein
MTDEELADARERADAWLNDNDGFPRVTRDWAVGEDHMALDVLDLLAEVERLTFQRATCDGSCDIALARRQVGPDAIVPGNARECAEAWEREAARLGRACDRLRRDFDAEREQLLGFIESERERGASLHDLAKKMVAKHDELRSALRECISMARSRFNPPEAVEKLAAFARLAGEP